MFSKVNSITCTSSHHIRKTTTTSLNNNKMKTIILSKLKNIMCPKLSIYKTRKSIFLFSSSNVLTNNKSTIIGKLHTCIIKIVIIVTTYMNILNLTMFIKPTRSIISILTSIAFTTTKLSMWNTIRLIMSIFIITNISISHKCKLICMDKSTRSNIHKKTTTITYKKIIMRVIITSFSSSFIATLIFFYKLFKRIFFFSHNIYFSNSVNTTMATLPIVAPPNILFLRLVELTCF